MNEEWKRIDSQLEHKVRHGERMTVTRYRFGKSGRFPLHRHDQEQFVYVVSGSIVFTVEGTPYPLSGGSMLLIGPRKVHEATAGGEGAEVVSVVTPARREDDAIEVLE